MRKIWIPMVRIGFRMVMSVNGRDKGGKDNGFAPYDKHTIIGNK